MTTTVTNQKQKQTNSQSGSGTPHKPDVTAASPGKVLKPFPAIYCVTVSID